MLEVNHITKKFKTFTLDDITFSLPNGYIMGYIGENGAGKSTTINCITHLCNPNSGEITINGAKYEENPTAYKESIGFIGDESYFPKEMKISEIRLIQKSFYSTFDINKFDELIAKFDLPKDKKISDFSRGMKVKLMFATVLSRETKLLVLDEATNGLDPVMRSEIVEILQDYVADGERSILFSTHMLEDLEQIADYIIFIHKGKLILNETKDDLLESYLIVKGDEHELTPEMRHYLIGSSSREYSFSALIKSNDAPYLKKNFIYDKPTIDEIMIHMIYEKSGKKGRM